MNYEYLTNLPPDEAVTRYLAFLDARGMTYRTERVRTQDALMRVTAEAVYAALCAPHYNACAMDGIALLAKRTFDATVTTPVLLLADEVCLEVLIRLQQAGKSVALDVVFFAVIINRNAHIAGTFVLSAVGEAGERGRCLQPFVQRKKLKR